MNATGYLVTGVAALALFFFYRRRDTAAQAQNVDNPPVSQGYGNVYINNDLSPIQLPAPNPIYQSYYMTSPGIPDVKVSFNIIGANLDWGYIPLFGLLPEFRP